MGFVRRCWPCKPWRMEELMRVVPRELYARVNYWSYTFTSVSLNPAIRICRWRIQKASHANEVGVLEPKSFHLQILPLFHLDLPDWSIYIRFETARLRLRLAGSAIKKCSISYRDTKSAPSGLSTPQIKPSLTGQFSRLFVIIFPFCFISLS